MLRFDNYDGMLRFDNYDDLWKGVHGYNNESDIFLFWMAV